MNFRLNNKAPNDDANRDFEIKLYDILSVHNSEHFASSQHEQTN